ncbi:MAG: bacterial transcriptional activator domain-containing protein [Coriobacteriales bacterium]|nr:bacterial transcriptional activator domain-containing protein [Coriobacteriales bacterium]
MPGTTEPLNAQGEEQQVDDVPQQIAQPLSPQMRFRSLVIEGNRHGCVVVLCAETGMGKTWLAMDVLHASKAKGRYTCSLNLSGLESAQACMRLTKQARELQRVKTRSNGLKVVVIDNVPPIEECDLAKAVRALNKMAECEAVVLVCVLPEVEPLMEELPKSIKFLSSDLANLYQAEEDPRHASGLQLSRGIAALIHANKEVHPDSDWRDQETAWRSAVSSVASRLVRDTLPLEEQGLRLAMLLLGSGDLDDLIDVVPKMDPDAFVWLQRDTPFFGIDFAQGTFSCVGLSSDEVFEHCAPVLRDACATLSKTVNQVARILAQHNNYQRLAVVCDLCAPQDMIEIACQWGVELVCQGKVTLVRKALSQHDRLGLENSLPKKLAAYAVSCLSDQGSLLRGDLLMREHLDTAKGYERKVRLLSLLKASRDLDRGLPPARIEAEDGDDYLARGLVKHVKARRLILQGKLTEAYGLLVNDPLRLEAGSLVAAFLCDDFELCQILIGELPREQERQAYQKARDFIESCGVARIACYRGIMTSLGLALAGRDCVFEGAEEAADRAARMGDDFIRAAILIALAVIDNRQDAYARAHVRALQATELISGPLGQHLMLVARFVDALSAVRLGDSGPLASLANRVTPSIVRDLSAYLMCADEEEAREVELGVLSRTSVSRDATWLLNVTCNDLGPQSTVFRGIIPPSWLTLSRRSVRNVQSYARQVGQANRELLANQMREELNAGEDGSTTNSELIAGAPTESAIVYISVLGEFGVSVNGRNLLGSSFTRRRTRSLITLLAVRRGHVMKRFEAIECVWPEADFESGRQRIYEATSFMRNQICKEIGELPSNPFIGNRSDGLIGFDTTVVLCDIDQFERLAYAALSEERDVRVIELSAKAMELYRGDLCESPYDATGIVEARREELRELFVDVSIAGASAALREDLLPLAVRTAWKAHETNGLREDAVRILVEALKLSGRTVDARNVYMAYARRLLEETGEPPSASLRALVARLFPTHKSAGKGVVPRMRKSRR